MTGHPEERPLPADWQSGPRYGGAYTFMRCPPGRDLSQADVAVVGVPLDTAVLYRPGARFGPRAIRDASGHMRPHAADPSRLEPPFDRLRVVDYGDIEVYPGYIEQSLARVQDEMAAILAGDTFPAVLGGDHSTTLPVLRAAAARHGALSLIHFDAHPDFWTAPRERPYHHGTVFRVAAAEGLIDPAASVQVGIRGSISAGIIAEARAAGFHLMTADEFARQGVRATVEAIQRVASLPVYVSLDIDCVDPAFAPGTGTPEVAGLTSREIVELVRGLAGLPLLGFDVVEVSPPYDTSEITALLAANLVYELLLVLARER
ncbi:MAG TPA: agmatinase [Dehalococcoidia bacterium]|nr:agmatinase [Dehalococcoidia bacterium]